jgi:hypothetical protein
MILAPDGTVVVAWDEQARGTRSIATARGTVDEKGTARFVRQPIGDGTRGEHPILAHADDATIVAWTGGWAGQTRIRTQRLVH